MGRYQESLTITQSLIGTIRDPVMAPAQLLCDVGDDANMRLGQLGPAHVWLIGESLSTLIMCTIGVRLAAPVGGQSNISSSKADSGCRTFKNKSVMFSEPSRFSPMALKTTKV